MMRPNAMKMLNRAADLMSLGASRLAKLGVHEVGAIIAVFLGAGLTLTFGAIAEEVVEGDTHQLDMAILMALRTTDNPADLIGPPWVEEMMRDVTALGSYAFIITILVATRRISFAGA